MAEFLMPKLSDTMEEGTVLQWLVGDGEQVEKGQPLVEVETDKANMTVEAPEAGRLEVRAGEGDVVAVGDPIATIVAGGGAPAATEEEPDAAPAVAEGEGEADPEEEGAPEQTNIPTGPDTTAREIGRELNGDEASPGAQEDYPGAEDEEEAPEQEEVTPEQEEVTPAEAPAARDGNGRQRSSPLARRLARELGVDLAGVRGTGPDGRVVRADVEAAHRGEPAALRTRAADDGGDGDGGRRAPASPVRPRRRGGGRTELSRLQRTVARRMGAAKAEAPHFYLERDVDVTDAVALRRALVDAAPDGAGPSLNDLVVRAVGMAGAEIPDALRRFDGDALVAPDGVHVGVAVATERGLLVPVVRDADRKGVGQIAAEVRDLATRTRDGSVAANELEGGAISVSNLGMFGVDRFAAILNPPEPAILAVGRAAPRPVARDGQVVVRTTMTLTLSVDHRALYGAEGAAFLGRIAELLERPHALVL